jgi:hypothetical protein
LVLKGGVVNDEEYASCGEGHRLAISRKLGWMKKEKVIIQQIEQRYNSAFAMEKVYPMM